MKNEIKNKLKELALDRSIPFCGIYPETTQVGWMTFDTIELINEI